MPADKGRRTGRTRQLKIEAYFRTLSPEDQIEARKFVSEDGRMLGGNTLDTIPKPFKYLVRYRFSCKFCGDYHTHTAGFLFCEKNPDRELAVENARKKAADEYYNHGRRGMIKNGNNVHAKRVSESIMRLHSKHSPEYKRKRSADTSNVIKKYIAENRDEHFAKIKKGREAYIEKLYSSSELLEQTLKNAGIVSPVIPSLEAQRIEQTFMNKDGFAIKKDLSDFSRDEYQTYDEFNNRYFDIDGDFDPFS